MWTNLRSDLTEFVSTVAGDTTEVLNRMDENFPDAEGDLPANDTSNDISKDTTTASGESGDEEDDEDDDDLAAAMEECVRRMKLKETFTTPLLPEKKKPAAVDAATKESNSAEATGSKEAGDGKDDKDEVVKDDGDDEEEEEEEDDDEDEDAKAEEEAVTAFLESFSLDAKTDEIASCLEAYPDTLKVMFEELVPTEVTYKEFWQRYFYRCDPERIAAEWDADEERAAANRKQAVKMGLTAVSNFLGGAVQAVSASLTEDDAGGSKDPNAPARRPPFVMSADSGDEDEEEVELGWDDDDDDEDDEEGDEQNQMQIEFKDAAAEKLQEQLKTAIEERDLLHQTVEMQTKEIAALKAAAAATSGDDDAPTKDTVAAAASSSSNNEELKKLKTEIFEKDAELAALRASILDTSGVAPDESSQNDALEQEIKRLSVQLNESETRAKEATSFLSKAKEEIEKASSQTKKAEGKLAQANGETQALQSKLEQSEERANQLEKELQAVQEQLSNQIQLQQQQQQQQQNAASAAAAAAAAAVVEGEDSVDSPATQDTVSSAVKVEAPPAAVEEAASTDEADGWDDDW